MNNTKKISIIENSCIYLLLETLKNEQRRKIKSITAYFR